IPRAIFMNRIDRENANFDETLSQIQSMLGKRCVPVQLPIGSQESFQGIIDLVEMKAFTGEKATPAEVPADMTDAAGAARDALIETVSEADDELINKYLEGEELTTDEVKRGLTSAIATGIIVPVFVGSATKAVGIQPFLDAVGDFFP